RGTTVANGSGRFQVTVTLTNLLLGQRTVTVTITATDPVTQRIGQRVLQLNVQ
ncbi:MAG: hypothetical protein JO199_02435, partial [Candidatus Eremiobacteraeota bacterium]|nr:hypothetical protein [Candidatus Eremiobacteraeota bacterium]